MCFRAGISRVSELYWDLPTLLWNEDHSQTKGISRGAAEIPNVLWSIVAAALSIGRAASSSANTPRADSVQSGCNSHTDPQQRRTTIRHTAMRDARGETLQFADVDGSKREGKPIREPSTVQLAVPGAQINPVHGDSTKTLGRRNLLERNKGAMVEHVFLMSHSQAPGQFGLGMKRIQPK
ncbi:hypothetical protein ASPBRDRAFT_30565 [Aspergillus brasiliensis CBS 101740]|uniref:Uncharacterized protein n=1 Tax=Aspergillus brasiliensis (strain CBS 101740 / IMI 381727 / IBT 21946) TaxID=767769 RepID=A0A1L9UKQ0_ASPBC|nr:hypothetical protein ASPBRDRAFT_30565 [Aspergillus brasiliensis CBS 101740]